MRMQRSDLQAELAERNPAFAELDALSAPDGDADLENVEFSKFDVPDCAACGGMLKPDVVFFGESVPKERVGRAMAAVTAADAMLVIGSSLMVYSGFRFARAMADSAKPVAAVNIGRTRADELLAFRIAAPCAGLLDAALQSLKAQYAAI
jgi:NAD-dependent SIR2 family protein deacetylase